jgi:hypothetical protein
MLLIARYLIIVFFAWMIFLSYFDSVTQEQLIGRYVANHNQGEDVLIRLFRISRETI